MLPIERLTVIAPHEAAVGTLLIGHAQRERPPMFIAELHGEKFFARLGGEEKPFELKLVANNMGPHLAIDQLEARVDHTRIVNPREHDVPMGALCLVGEQTALALNYDGTVVFVTLAGTLVKRRPDYENLAAFTKWSLVTRVGDVDVPIFEADLPPQPTAN